MQIINEWNLDIKLLDYMKSNSKRTGFCAYVEWLTWWKVILKWNPDVLYQDSLSWALTLLTVVHFDSFIHKTTIFFFLFFSFFRYKLAMGDNKFILAQKFSKFWVILLYKIDIK